MTRFDRTRTKTKRAQNLRNNATRFEKQLWSRLNNRQMAGFKFRRQHAVGPYVLDFYCAELDLCIELDGEHHGYDAKAFRDRTRTDFLNQKGIKVLRFWNNELTEDFERVLDSIYEHVTALKMERDAVPSPCKGEG